MARNGTRGETKKTKTNSNGLPAVVLSTKNAHTDTSSFRCCCMLKQMIITTVTIRISSPGRLLHVLTDPLPFFFPFLVFDVFFILVSPYNFLPERIDTERVFLSLYLSLYLSLFLTSFTDREHVLLLGQAAWLRQNGFSLPRSRPAY